MGSNPILNIFYFVAQLDRARLSRGRGSDSHRNIIYDRFV